MANFTILENGGTALVVGGFNKAWQSFKDNPRVTFWSGDQKDIARAVREKTIPSNCKAVLISRFISHSELNVLLPEVRKRANITLFPNKSDGEITDILEKLLPKEVKKQEEDIPASKADKKEIQGRGKTKEFVAKHADWTKGSGENARRMIEIARQEGFKTTEASLAQCFLQLRKRQRGVTAVPKSIQSKLDVTVEMLDSMINDLSGMRDYLIELTEENRMLKKRVAKFKAALEEE